MSRKALTDNDPPVDRQAENAPVEQRAEWRVILDMLRQTDPKLLLRISRKMTNFLCWSGIREAEPLLDYFNPASQEDSGETEEQNRPHKKRNVLEFLSVTEEIFKIAQKHLSEAQILEYIHKWIKEDRSGFLVNVLENPGSSLEEIIEALERYHFMMPPGVALSEPREKGFRVSLIRRLMMDQSQFINIAKKFIRVSDFYDLLQKIIYPPNSHGKLGGKGSSLFLAKQILKKAGQKNELLRDVKTPRTWYITSDGVLAFMHYNNLEDVIEQKYKDIAQVRQEYPYVVQVFKNSQLPPEMLKGLAVALEDFGNTPLIVRSSSLLEDRLGTAFAGKYKSLFIANQGSKEERLAALADAIVEVYASTFGPDPIEYRMERGLIDFHEEMGVLIQEVVGRQVGHYYFPAYAGVAFSNNEYRWSIRIKREDGLVRIVPGLGTRAVDRLSDDYPILVSPGQPGLRVNVTVDEAVRYSPKKMDVINLKTNTFETIEIEQLLREFGYQYKGVNQIVSILKHKHIQQPMGMGIDFEKDKTVVTFEGLISRTPFLKKMHAILQELQDKLETPVDIEFASDGEDFYLLQCRPQSYSEDRAPADIPEDLPEDHQIFSANRYISNGVVSDITHVVYIDPQSYSRLKRRSDLLAVGKAVGRLNQMLPKRRFILIGPGRWGSRGDIRLGVSVTYSEISNTAMLIEVARKKGNYVPDLSFGTHFFQDLVESDIRYLPLYPDEPGNIFNESFFLESANILAEILPEYSALADAIRVIDVPRSHNGRVLTVAMNADREAALAYLSEPTHQPEKTPAPKSTAKPVIVDLYREDHWRWRAAMAEKIAAGLANHRFGVEQVYLFGSAKTGNARADSDINLIIHFRGNEQERQGLLNWLEGWSMCLSEMNYLRTGCKCRQMLDVHLVSDEDIREGRGFAAKIDAATDPARPLLPEPGKT